MVDIPGHPRTAVNTIVVTLPVEIDMANAGQVHTDLDAAFGPGAGVVVADMSGTRFCDTSGIHALVMAHKRAQASHTEFRVVAGPGEVRHMLTLLGLERVLAVYPALPEALAVEPAPGP